jgi:multisubunit Na+/H+ antiporter MnhC subunit
VSRVAVAAARPIRSKHARSGMFTGAATLSLAASSGIQALLYVSAFGVTGRTDGLFAAFAPYAVFGLFSQSIRVSSVPLLVGPRALSPRAFAGALAFIGLPVLIATTVLAAPLSHALAPGLSSADRAVTADALPLLGVAMVLHLWAAGEATLLTVRDRHVAAAGGYIAGAAAGLATYVAVSGAAGELSLAWSMLATSAVVFLWMSASLRGSAKPGAAAGRALDLRAVPGHAARILGRTVIYLAFNGLFLVTLAVISGYSAGEASVLSYTYLYASYVVGGTGFSLGLSRIADMRRSALEEADNLVTDTVAPGFRYSMLVAAPALGVLIVMAAPLVGELASRAAVPADAGTVRAFSALLAPWTVAALLVNLLLPAMFAVGRARFVNLLAPGLIALHLAASGAGALLFGAVGAVGAAAVAPLCFALVLLRAGTGHGRAPGLAAMLARDGLHFSLLAALAFGGGALAAGSFAHGVPGAFAAAAIGGAAYVAALCATAPRQVRVLAAGFRPLAAAKR